MILTGYLVTVVVLCMTVFVSGYVSARDDGRYTNNPLHKWFDQLASGKGLCVWFVDGFSIQDVDWDTQDGRYRVRLHGEWIVVPDSAGPQPEPSLLRVGCCVALHGCGWGDTNPLLHAGRRGLSLFRCRSSGASKSSLPACCSNLTVPAV